MKLSTALDETTLEGRSNFVCSSNTNSLTIELERYVFLIRHIPSREDCHELYDEVKLVFAD